MFEFFSGSPVKSIENGIRTLQETSWYDPWLADRERGESNPLEDIIDALVGYEEAVRGKDNPLFHSDHIDFARDQIRLRFVFN